jgi:hypothetical protein
MEELATMDLSKDRTLKKKIIYIYVCVYVYVCMCVYVCICMYVYIIQFVYACILCMCKMYVCI